ncbi:ladinin-1 isoform X2 [Pogoniulus pusillus]|uniref:ladinin-1 isoform X2 n=1 Tax=Pogoniulus pusillus TaxID=488313 RepID=UPI0030B93687
MALGRRNWSDLSSLARQRTLEDEEEQQRERRRRHRNLLSSSSSVDEEPLSPAKDTSAAPSRPQSLVKALLPEDGKERKLSEVLNTQEARRTRAPMAISEKLRQEKEQREPGGGASPAEPGPQPPAGQESIQAGEQGREVAKGRQDPPGEQQLESASERKVVVRGRLQDKEERGVGAPRGEQRKEAADPQQQAPPEVGSCRLREVKILSRQGSRSAEEKPAPGGSSALELQPSRSPSKVVIQLSATQEVSAEKSEASPSHISSIRRTSPRTVSFRMISRKEKEESQSPLTRSASLRIPGSSTATIGEKLEKYTSAVQRSEGAKCCLAAQKGLVLPSEGVATKRSFFEASAPGRAEPLPGRKDNLKIPGSVTSRINLWISRAQEPAKEEKSKDIRRVNSLASREVWVRRSGGTPGDTKLPTFCCSCNRMTWASLVCSEDQSQPCPPVQLTVTSLPCCV